MTKKVVGVFVRFRAPLHGAINRMGMLYDYRNSVWLASMGTVGKTVLGIYQISELVTSILVNPFWRRDLRSFFPSQDFDDDRPGVWTPLFGDFFYQNDRWMIAALIVANIVQAIAFAFSRTANKAIITEGRREGRDCDL